MDKMEIPIAEIMTKRPITVESGRSVNYAAKLMFENHISSILVMNKKELIGLITSDDMVYKILSKKEDPQKLTVDDIMSSNIISISPTSSLEYAMQTLSDNDIRQLPIINNGILVGLVTLKDVLRFEPTLVDIMVENIRFEEQQRQEEIKKYSEGAVDESLFE